MTTFTTINGTAQPNIVSAAAYTHNVLEEIRGQPKNSLRINVRTAVIKLIIRCFILAPPPATAEPSSAPPPNPAPAAEYGSCGTAPNPAFAACDA